MAKDWRPKTEDRHWEACRLYLQGPQGLKGRWRACCLKVGFQRIPALNSKTVQYCLERVRDRIAVEGEIEPYVDWGEEEAVGEAKGDLEELESFLTGDSDLSWDSALPLARKVLARIATGRVEASQGQVQALKEIVARAEGKIGAKASEGQPVGVVLLPALKDEKGLVSVEGEAGDSVEELHNRMARREAKKGKWERERQIPGGGYRSEEYGGPSL